MAEKKVNLTMLRNLFKNTLKDVDFSLNYIKKKGLLSEEEIIDFKDEMFELLDEKIRTKSHFKRNTDKPKVTNLVIEDIQEKKKYEFPSYAKAAQFIGVSPSNITLYIQGKRQKPIRKRFIPKLIEKEH